MTRTILAVVAGFVVWTILWIGSDAVFSLVSPDWYGRNLAEFQAAIENHTTYTADSTMLIMALIRSVFCSLIAGYAAVMIAGGDTRPALALGVVLLLFGIFIQSIYWAYIPLWYHIPFLALLIPVTVLGGRLRRTGPARMQEAV